MQTHWYMQASVTLTMSVTKLPKQRIKRFCHLCSIDKSIEKYRDTFGIAIYRSIVSIAQHCCGRDDRAVRLIWVTWKFSGLPDYASTPTATFSKFFMDFRSDRPCECAYKINLKSVALAVPGLIWVAKMGDAVPGYAHALYSPEILYAYHTDYSLNVYTHFPAIFDWNFAWGCEPPI